MSEKSPLAWLHHWENSHQRTFCSTGIIFLLLEVAQPCVVGTFKNIVDNTSASIEIGPGVI